MPPPPADAPPPALVDPSKDRFPYCIVWTPIPVLTWVLPFVGHMGVADSQGVISDFAGPFFVSRDAFAFGRPTRYLRLRPGPGGAQAWDAALARADAEFEHKMHNLCCQNCHSHVATHLDLVALGGFTHYNMIILAFWMFFAGTFVSLPRAAYSLGPSVLFWGLVVIVATSSSSSRHVS